MPELGPIAWPPAPIQTGRLVLREPERWDRAALIDLLASPDSLPEVWGHGYAAEACAAALDWFATALPGEPVVLATQIANTRSMRLASRLGFREEERYEAYGAEQWLGVRLLAARPV
ncbi:MULTISPECIES: GNAT family N-acetyltransferase [unclassified Streptomyces]|uniref:GNAT family N-acetyltransferase n=1 Tax=unclassified Streptomyces TaxID=2593676 RepID=UPI0033C52995